MVYNIIDKKKLHMLNPREYEHPLDKKALDTLKDTPGLEKLTKEFYKHGLERVLRVQYTGSYLKVTDSHFPKVKEILKKYAISFTLPIFLTCTLKIIMELMDLQ